MKFKEVNVNTFKGYKETKIQRTLAEFIKAEIAVAEVILEEGEYRSVSSAYSALNSGIKRMNLANVAVKVKEKRLYLINKLLYDEAVENLQKVRI